MTRRRLVLTILILLGFAIGFEVTALVMILCWRDYFDPAIELRSEQAAFIAIGGGVVGMALMRWLLTWGGIDVDKP